jgi:hypothetical protein
VISWLILSQLETLHHLQDFERRASSSGQPLGEWGSGEAKLAVCLGNRERIQITCGNVTEHGALWEEDPMKNLFVSLFISVSLTSIAQAADQLPDFYPTAISCMQTQTNDGFLPQNLTIYQAKNSDTLLIKFYIENDLRYVVAELTSRTFNTVQYKNVRLFDEEKGKIVGGHIGITFDAELSALQSQGNLTWTYFDGGKAVYSCSVN